MSVQDVIAQARDSLTVKRVFGDPYEKDGVVLVPAAAVRGGAAGDPETLQQPLQLIASGSCLVASNELAGLSLLSSLSLCLSVLSVCGCSRKGGPTVTNGVSVRCASRDNPLMVLPRDVGDQFEVCVVMEHGEIVSLSHSGHEGINQRDRPVSAPDGKGCLDIEPSSMVGLIGWQEIERRQ